MEILNIDHITINCRDYQASRRFYENILDLQHISDVDLGDHELHYFQLPATRLELIEYKDKQKNWRTGNTDTGIYRHFAIVVDNLDELNSKCSQNNIPINLPPSYIEKINKKVMLFQDPNGVEIEAIQA